MAVGLFWKNMKIRIVFKGLSLEAKLNRSDTAKKVADALPIESTARTWGDEIYFEIPVDALPEPDARRDVEAGELGYWPEGKSFCVFFGPTPASKDDNPRAYSEVNIIGRLAETPVEKLKTIKSGSKVKIEQAKKS
jgi:uncharacterized protein